MWDALHTALNMEGNRAAAVQAVAAVVQAILTVATLIAAVFIAQYQARLARKAKSALVVFVGGEAHEQGHTEIIFRNYGDDVANSLTVNLTVVRGVGEGPMPSIQALSTITFEYQIAPNQHGTVTATERLSEHTWFLVDYTFVDSQGRERSGRAGFKPHFRPSDEKHWTYRSLLALNKDEMDRVRGLPGGAAPAAGGD